MMRQASILKFPKARNLFGGEDSIEVSPRNQRRMYDFYPGAADVDLALYDISRVFWVSQFLHFPY